VLVTHPGASLYGSDRMLLEAVRGMVDVGWSPLLLVPETGALTDAVAEWGVPVRTGPVPVLRKSALTPTGILRLAAQTLAAARQGWDLLVQGRPDVVYVSTVTTPLWPLLARVRGVPVVCHVHEAESEAPGVLQRALVLPLLAADALVVNSRFALDVLLRSAPRLRDRSAVVLNGVEGPPAAAPPRLGGGPVRLLYVGRLSERKGVLVALEALELLVAEGLDAHLDLVGGVFSEHAAFGEELRRRAARPQLAGRTTFHGFQDDVWPHLAACDILLVPSVLAEPFGNTAVEGVLAGRPVVASDVGGLPEALEGYRSARLVRPLDASALAAAIGGAVDQLPTLLELAREDAVAAAARHDPQRYRRAVTARVASVARGGSAA